jgi:hypothetical protein|tara:strand:- start:442 stop:612 length:171 start_codon:yes stop_codon:yes gene_type:complete
MKTKLQMIQARLAILLASKVKYKSYDQGLANHKRDLELCKEELKGEEERINRRWGI